MDLVEVFDKNTFVWTFFQLHLGFGVFAQQVVYFLVVDLNKTATDEMGFRCVVFSDSNNLTERSRNNPSGLLAVVTTHHGVSLTASGLSVGKDGSIVAIQDVFH